jgi:hypothetical protein
VFNNQTTLTVEQQKFTDLNTIASPPYFAPYNVANPRFGLPTRYANPRRFVVSALLNF